MHESLLAFRKRFYLWVSLLVVAVSVAAYWYHDPQEPPNGGTLLGYILGTVGALLIVWLALFGVRKRRYASTLGTVQGWLSAHIYLGIALIVVVLLHAGFQFGWNVHTLAFVLMMLVILSGVFGVIVYLRYPERMSRNRGGAPRSELVDELEDIDRRSLRVAEALGADFHEFVASGVQRTQLGATLWERFRGRDSSQVLLRQGGETVITANPGQDAALDWLAEQQQRAFRPDPQQAQIAAPARRRPEDAGDAGDMAVRPRTVDGRATRRAAGAHRNRVPVLVTSCVS